MVKTRRIGKKGLTPVIAVILLLMMTVAAAGAAFFWFVRIQSEMQGGAESYSEQLSETISTMADVSEIDVMSDESIKIILRNTGNRDIPVSNKEKVTWILKDSDNNVVCNQQWNASAANQSGDTYCQTGCGSDIPVKTSREILLNISNSSHDCYVGGYSNGTMFRFKIEFAGSTGTGGQFEKEPAD